MDLPAPLDESTAAPPPRDGLSAPGAPSAPLPPGLYLVGTPIGNREDITLRALRVLRSASVVFAEDTRHTRPLLDFYSISTPLVSCHKFNERSRADELVQRIASGQSVALVSDAGMPGISDPGARSAAAVRAAGLPVTVIPGPCALSSAVALCGCSSSHSFWFEGFLDHKTAARRRRLAELSALDAPVVFYESTHRILKLLDEVEETLSPTRRLFIAREITKLHEETILGTPADLRRHYQTHSLKGEFVVILLPPAPS